MSLGSRKGPDATNAMAVIVDKPGWLPLTENWLHTQVRHLPETISPHVVCSTIQNRDRFAVSQLWKLSEFSPGRRAGVLLSGAWRLRHRLSRRMSVLAYVADRFDVRVVHSHFGYTAYSSMPTVEKLGLRHIVSFYGVDMSALPQSDPRWLDRYAELFSRVESVLCEGPCMARRIAALGCPPEKLVVQHLGIDISAFPFRPRVWSGDGPLRVLIAASYREKKGIPYALEALARLKDRVDIEITIIGDAGSNPKSQLEKTRIGNLIDASGLRPNVRMLGYQSHDVLLDEALKHHIFLSPSVTASDGDTEGGAPVTLIEMAATGMPIVSSCHADIPEVIRHESGGLLAQERDVDMLVAHLSFLVSHPESWHEIGATARAHVQERFDARVQGRILANIYANSINRAWQH